MFAGFFFWPSPGMTYSLLGLTANCWCHTCPCMWATCEPLCLALFNRAAKMCRCQEGKRCSASPRMEENTFDQQGSKIWRPKKGGSVQDRFFVFLHDWLNLNIWEHAAGLQMLHSLVTVVNTVVPQLQCEVHMFSLRLCGFSLASSTTHPLNTTGLFVLYALVKWCDVVWFWENIWPSLIYCVTSFVLT